VRPYLSSLVSSTRRVALAAGLLLLLPGCASLPGFGRPARAPQTYTPTNYSGETVLPVGLRRVLLLPACGGTVAPPESTLALDEELHTALQRQARFEVVTASREDCRVNFGAPELSSASALPHGFMEKVRRIYGADAVMFVDVTVYQPYRPLALGFRAKLATVQDVHLVWTFDEVLSAANPAVANGVQHHATEKGRATTPVELAPNVIQSPGRFAAFVADEMFGTLPPR